MTVCIMLTLTALIAYRCGAASVGRKVEVGRLVWRGRYYVCCDEGEIIKSKGRR